MPPPSDRLSQTPADRFIRALVRTVIRAFFREVEVVGADRLPLDRPLVLVANHINSLVDPILVLGPLPVTPRFLATSQLWKNPILRFFLGLAQVIPVYRKQDDGGDTSRNAETFARCHEVLRDGGVIALFPEGISHNHPGLQPLKTGAARIVLEAEEKFPGLGVRIVPVGLFFDARGRFRSRALVEAGEPLDPAPELALYQKDAPGAVRALTARIDEALQDVTVNYATWEDARLVARAADLWAQERSGEPGEVHLARTAALERVFREGYEALRSHHPEQVKEVAEAVREYDRILRWFRLRDAQVASDYEPPRVARFVGWTLFHLFIHLPLAAVGTVLNWPTYRLVGFLANRIARFPDQVATWKVFVGLFLFPLTWIAEAVLAARWLGDRMPPWLAVLLALAAGPLTGWAMVRFDERRRLFQREARAWFLLTWRRNLFAELRGRRQRVLRGVQVLAEVYRAGEGKLRA
jgi:glycerol-3-phosphate O-acyltransferase/dihydroxyacetone phosphate acyltransferase